MDDSYTRRKLAVGIILALLLTLGLIGEAMTDRIVRFWLGVIVCSLVVLMVALGAALAHDHVHPELTPWFKSLKSHKGYCCDGTDALHLRDVDWETQNKEDSHFRVRIPAKGEDMAKAAMGEEVETMWIDVPDEAVVDEPNRDGATLVWPLYGYSGANIRCFMPGMMG